VLVVSELDCGRDDEDASMGMEVITREDVCEDGG
jgi:hypothetical protein